MILVPKELEGKLIFSIFKLPELKSNVTEQEKKIYNSWIEDLKKDNSFNQATTK
jgi:hypothetical protein|nr:MAG TPA: hypothetical protein [Caudoviricetes sp.]